MTRTKAAITVVALVALALPLLVKDPFLTHIMIVVLLYAVLASSLNLIVGYTGQPSLNLFGLARFDFSDKAHFYYLILGLVAVNLYVSYRFVQSNMGRAAVAIRENRQLAQSVGINPFRYALLAFVIGAFFAGLAGAFYAHYITYVGPDVFGFAFTVTML